MSPVRDFFSSLAALGGGGAVALCIWFLIRYIQKNDDFELETNKRFINIRQTIQKEFEEMKTTLKKFEDGFKAFGEQNLSSQKDLNKELFSVKKEALEIEKSIQSTAQSAKDLKETVDSVKLGLEQVQISLRNHRELIKKGGQVLSQHHGDLGVMKTTVKQLSDNVRIFGHKIEKKEGS